MARSTASAIGGILITACVTLTACGNSPTPSVADSTTATTGTPTSDASAASPSTDGASPSQTSAPAADAVPTCADADLTVSVSPGGAGLGHVGSTIVFTNASDHQCALTGYPTCRRGGQQRQRGNPGTAYPHRIPRGQLHQGDAAARAWRQRLGTGRGDEHPRRGSRHVRDLSPPAGHRTRTDPLTRLCLEHAGMLALAGPPRRGRSHRTHLDGLTSQRRLPASPTPAPEPPCSCRCCAPCC